MEGSSVILGCEMQTTPVLVVLAVMAGSALCVETQQEDPAVRYDIKASRRRECLLTGVRWL